MPIRRTYACPECNHYWEIELTLDQADAPAPDCPRCIAYDLQTTGQQQFKAPGIVNSSPQSRANAVAEDILANDYHVANMQRDHRAESRPSRVRYKDQSGPTLPSTWGSSTHVPVTLGDALAIGRQNRKEFGTGLDVLQANLKSGAQKDLIEVSKQRSAKVW
jgi:hypothetical protein